MKEEVVNFIIGIIESQYPIDLNESSSLYNDAELDSLDVVDLCASIEDEYNVHISDDEYPVFKETISDVADLVVSKL